MKIGGLILVASAALIAGCSGDDTDTAAGAIDASSDSPSSTSGDATVNGANAGPNPCEDAGTPASTLECTGLYANFATKELAGNALAYTPSTPLWSDGAQKQRWIELPPNTQIDISNPDEWTFPVGTKLFKEFRVGGQRVETRMFEKTTSDFWVYATYAWSPDGESSTTVNFGGPVPVGDDGGTWTIPTNDACNECHRGRQDRILGFEQVSLGLPLAQGLTLEQLVEQGLVTPAPARTSLTIGDDGTGLDSITMGWIHVNCGVTCHNSNPSAAGYGAGMLLRLHAAQLDGTPPNAATWDILNTTVNVLCVSGAVAGIPRILPNNPAGSAIYQLIDERGAIQMPPIGSLLVDTPDVAVISSWIQTMPIDGGVSDDGGDDGGEPIFDAGEHEGGGHRADGGRLDAGHDAADEDAGNEDGGVEDAGEDAPAD